MPSQSSPAMAQSVLLQAYGLQAYGTTTLTNEITAFTEVYHRNGPKRHPELPPTCLLCRILPWSSFGTSTRQGFACRSCLCLRRLIRKWGGNCSCLRMPGRRMCHPGMPRGAQFGVRRRECRVDIPTANKPGITESPCSILFPALRPFRLSNACLMLE